MKDCLWTKTLLTVYRYLERISGAIDKIILQSGLASANISGQNYFHNNVMAVSQKIIDLSQRKVTLINLKVLIEDILREMNAEEAGLLIEKYFDGVKSRELVERYGISMRTLFRRLDVARNSFASKLVVKGFDSAGIFVMLSKEKWILNVHKRFASKDEEELLLSEVFLAKAVS